MSLESVFKELMGLCWIHALASLHKMCVRIHKHSAHPEISTARANPRHGTVICAPWHKLSSTLTPGCWAQE